MTEINTYQVSDRISVERTNAIAFAETLVHNSEVFNIRGDRS